MQCEGELINMTRAWDKEKILSPNWREPVIRELFGSLNVVNAINDVIHVCIVYVCIVYVVPALPF